MSRDRRWNINWQGNFFIQILVKFRVRGEAPEKDSHYAGWSGLQHMKGAVTGGLGTGK
jgi:hypothetical protein